MTACGYQTCRYLTRSFAGVFELVTAGTYIRARVTRRPRLSRVSSVTCRYLAPCGGPL
jgi:hypothetical protein